MIVCCVVFVFLSPGGSALRQVAGRRRPGCVSCSCLFLFARWLGPVCVCVSLLCNSICVCVLRCLAVFVECLCPYLLLSVCICTSTRLYTRIPIHTYTETYIYIYTHLCIHACIPVCISMPLSRSAYPSLHPSLCVPVCPRRSLFASPACVCGYGSMGVF